MSDSRARGWCFTINNYTELDEHIVFEMAEYSKYVVCGRDWIRKWNATPPGLCLLRKQKSLNQVKEIHSTAHWEAMRGTVNQAAEYCQKKAIISRQELGLLIKRKRVNAEN